MARIVEGEHSKIPLDRIGYVLANVLEAAQAGNMSKTRADAIYEDVMAHVVKLNLASQKRVLDQIYRQREPRLPVVVSR
jgi:hypothetical protein